MRAVISVVGHDTVGILAKVSSECARYRANVVEVSQSVLQDMFAMMMIVEISALTCPLRQLADAMEQLGKEENLVIHVMHEDIFRSMHRI